MTTRTACENLTLPLHSPVVVGACPLTMEPELLRQMVACGAGAVVLPSIFQEQFTDPDRLEPQTRVYNAGPDTYLRFIQETRRLVSVPVIASLNGYDDGEWLDFARRMEASGAAAIELNIQPVIDDPLESAEAIETKLVEIVRQVCQSVAIPVAVKMSRRFTNLARVVRRFQSAGAAGVVLFAHDLQWDVAIGQLQSTTRWELTPLDSVGATVAGIVQARTAELDLSIAASGGVRTAEDAIKVLIAGADVAMITSEIYRAGPTVIRQMVQGVKRYLETAGYPTLVSFFKASFLQARPDARLRSPSSRRADYLVPLTRSSQYRDPTPVLVACTGDRYGHQD